MEIGPISITRNRRPTIDTIGGVDVFRLENNKGVSFEDVIRGVETLNDIPVMTYKDRVVGRGVYSDKELRVALELGHIVCDPRPNKVNGSSIDVRLGENFYLAGNARNVQGMFNPFDSEDVNRYFGEPKEAKAARIVIAKTLENLEYLQESGVISDAQFKTRQEYLKDTDEIKGLDPDHPIILLRPGERILAHTDEFIGIKAPGTTSMQTRSTIGRTGVATCFCAGWGDPGYVNRWTMEVNNLNEFEYIPLAHGQRVAQLVFMATGGVSTEYAISTGKYQNDVADNIVEIKKNWKKNMILPQQQKDIEDLANWREKHLNMLAA